MSTDEREVFYFLKTWGQEFVGVNEICRRAGGRKRFVENPEWAKPLLLAMTERGILERDAVGRYRVAPLSRKQQKQRWLSPEIAQILREGGMEVEDSGSIGPDEHYEQL